MSIKSIFIETAIGKREVFFRPDASDRDVLKQVFDRGEYAFLRFRQGQGLIELCQRQAERGLRPLIIDAGANIGAASLYFAATFPRARIIAIEPVRENYDMLVRNTQGLDVIALHAALAVRPGHMEVVD